MKGWGYFTKQKDVKGVLYQLPNYNCPKQQLKVKTGANWNNFRHRGPKRKYHKPEIVP